MNLTELRETQQEAMEICHHVTDDLRQRRIALWQWLDITRHALLDFWGAVAEYQRTKGN